MPGRPNWRTMGRVLTLLKHRTCTRSASAQGSPASRLSFHHGARARQASLSLRMVGTVAGGDTGKAVVAVTAALVASAAAEDAAVAGPAFPGTEAAAAPLPTGRADDAGKAT